MISSDHLKPGASGEIRANFDTSDKVGRVEKYITVYSNDPRTPALTLSLSADIEEKKKH